MGCFQYLGIWFRTQSRRLGWGQEILYSSGLLSSTAWFNSSWPRAITQQFSCVVAPFLLQMSNKTSMLQIQGPAFHEIYHWIMPSALISSFHWLIYLFNIFIYFTYWSTYNLTSMGGRGIHRTPGSEIGNLLYQETAVGRLEANLWKFPERELLQGAGKRTR